LAEQLEIGADGRHEPHTLVPGRVTDVLANEHLRFVDRVVGCLRVLRPLQTLPRRVTRSRPVVDDDRGASVGRSAEQEDSYTKVRSLVRDSAFLHQTTHEPLGDTRPRGDGLDVEQDGTDMCAALRRSFAVTLRITNGTYGEGDGRSQRDRI
jgi:hypothetical protein